MTDLLHLSGHETWLLRGGITNVYSEPVKHLRRSFLQKQDRKGSEKAYQRLLHVQRRWCVLWVGQLDKHPFNVNKWKQQNSAYDFSPSLTFLDVVLVPLMATWKKYLLIRLLLM